jgi:hypothetical protein
MDIQKDSALRTYVLNSEQRHHRRTLNCSLLVTGVVEMMMRELMG